LGGATASAAVINNQGITTVTITGISTLSPGSYSPSLLLISNFGEQYEIPLEVNVCNTINVEETVITRMTVYPNPTQDEIQVQLNKAVDAIEIFDSVGKRVLNMPTINGQLLYTIDARSMAEGAYSVKAGEDVTRIVIAR
jgi:hypothetical protein